MTGKTHIIGGIALGTLYSMKTGLLPEATAITTGLAVIGALFPDIDQPQSKLGRVIPFISIPIYKIFGHRGILHAPLLYLILGFLGLKFYNEYSFYIIAMLIGVFSHLALDLLNPMGIPLFYPCKKKINIFSIYTGSAGETIIAILMIIITTLYASESLNLIG